MKTRPTHAAQIIFATSYQYWLSAGLLAIHQLNIPALLQHQSLTLEELAQTLMLSHPELNKDHLFRIMRNMSVAGIFSMLNTDSFALTLLGRELLSNDIRDCIDQQLNHRWQKIADLNDSSEESFAIIFGEDDARLSPELAMLVYAYRDSRALYLFTDLGLADLFAAQSWSLPALTQHLKIAAPVVAIICATMLAKGIIAQDQQGAYQLTAAGQLLSRNARLSLHHVPLHENTAKWQSAAYLALAVTTGKPPFNSVFGTDIFAYLKELDTTKRHELDIFNRAMAEISAMEIQAICHEFTVPVTTRVIMDVGGGTGALLRALLSAHQHLHGIIFDLPETIAHINHRDARCKTAGGNFFDKETLPAADLILLKRTLHDWTDAQAVTILKNCAEKCREIRVIEWLWNNTVFSATLDLALMSIGGKIRYRQEFTRLFSLAGVTNGTIVDLSTQVLAVNLTPPEEDINHSLLRYGLYGENNAGLGQPSAAMGASAYKTSTYPN